MAEEKDAGTTSKKATIDPKFMTPETTTELEENISDSSVFVPDVKRAAWPNKVEFVLAILGYAIGIGNVWRYPYLCYRNGGGAFVLAYLSMVLLCGFPLFYMESAWGQFLSSSCISMFRICPIFKGVGFATVLNNVYLNCYYVIILSYPLLFIIKIMRPTIPWSNCQNPWNTDKCYTIGENRTSNKSQVSPSDEFFHNEILKISKGVEEIGTIHWQLFGCLVFTWVVVYLCIRGGIKSIGKVVYFTSLFPVITMVILLIRGVTLEGALDGAIYYIKPDFKRLGDLKVWADAAGQVCFSVGPGWGGIVSMASFNDFQNNAFGDAILIVSLNVIISIVAGFVVFTILGFLSHSTGIDISEVAAQGPSLAFVTYPEALTRLPIPHFWAAVFFFMLFILGMSTVFVQIEAIIRSCIDEYQILRPYQNWVILASVLVMFLMSISMVTNGGLYIVSILDYYVINLPVICICLIEAIIVSWIYGVSQFADDIFFMVHKRPSKVLLFFWKYITPLILVFIMITTIAFGKRLAIRGVELPTWSIAIGWGVCGITIAIIPIYALFKIFKKPRFYKERFQLYTKPRNWCPADTFDCKRYTKYLKRKPNTA